MQGRAYSDEELIMEVQETVVLIENFERGIQLLKEMFPDKDWGEILPKRAEETIFSVKTKASKEYDVLTDEKADENAKFEAHKNLTAAAGLAEFFIKALRENFLPKLTEVFDEYQDEKKVSVEIVDRIDRWIGLMSAELNLRKKLDETREIEKSIRSIEGKFKKALAGQDVDSDRIKELQQRFDSEMQELKEKCRKAEKEIMEDMKSIRRDENKNLYAAKAEGDKKIKQMEDSVLLKKEKEFRSECTKLFIEAARKFPRKFTNLVTANEIDLFLNPPSTITHVMFVQMFDALRDKLATDDDMAKLLEEGYSDIVKKHPEMFEKNSYEDFMQALWKEEDDNRSVLSSFMQALNLKKDKMEKFQILKPVHMEHEFSSDSESTLSPSRSSSSLDSLSRSSGDASSSVSPSPKRTVGDIEANISSLSASVGEMSRFIKEANQVVADLENEKREKALLVARQKAVAEVLRTLFGETNLPRSQSEVSAFWQSQTQFGSLFNRFSIFKNSDMPTGIKAMQAFLSEKCGANENSHTWDDRVKSLTSNECIEILQKLSSIASDRLDTRQLSKRTDQTSEFYSLVTQLSKKMDNASGLSDVARKLLSFLRENELSEDMRREVGQQRVERARSPSPRS
ncbi:MAG: hypothetical protein SFW66_10245 [Gammaproteobacteria bacterium]|nr:hypothetical protein [Gammaproteobacteria bacterium]